MASSSWDVRAHYGALVEPIHHKPAKLHMLDGLKALSMFWIHLGHTLVFCMVLSKSSTAWSIADATKKSFIHHFYVGSWFGVDTFFFISGFLTASRVTAKLRTVKNPVTTCFKLAFDRYVRLTTLLVVLLWASYQEDANSTDTSAPQTQFISNADEGCKVFWPRVLLLIHNIAPPLAAESCLPWTWSLASEMQFFVVALVIIATYLRSRKIGWSLLVTLLTTCLTCSVVLAVRYQVPSATLDSIGLIFTDGMRYDSRPTLVALVDSGINAPYFGKFYIAPWVRLQSYLIGLALGFYFLDHLLAADTQSKKAVSEPLERRDSCVQRNGKYIAAEIVIVAVLASLVSMPYLADMRHWLWTPAVDCAYVSISRMVWAVCIAGLFYLNVIDQLGSILTRFLSAPIWSQVSKLSYAYYLLHPIVVIMWFTNQEEVEELSSSRSLFFHFGLTAVICLAVSALFHVCVEVPLRLAVYEVLGFVSRRVTGVAQKKIH